MIATSIEQSKKLLKLGLSPKSADMYYREWKRDTKNISLAYVKGVITNEDLPCWSVGALLEVMPAIIDNTFKLKCIKDNIVAGYYFSYHDKNDKRNKTVFTSKTPTDAAYNMVVWLLENNYIKKGV